MIFKDLILFVAIFDSHEFKGKSNRINNLKVPLNYHCSSDEFLEKD